MPIASFRLYYYDNYIMLAYPVEYKKIPVLFLPLSGFAFGKILSRFSY